MKFKLKWQREGEKRLPDRRCRGGGKGGGGGGEEGELYSNYTEINRLENVLCCYSEGFIIFPNLIPTTWQFGAEA